MQIADRFHLHQNLLEAIKKALNRELPATIKIPHTVDNPPILNQKRYQLILQMQAFVEEALNLKFEPQPYVRTQTKVNDNHTGTDGENESHIIRAGVFKHLWMNTKLSEYNREFIFEKYPVLYKIKISIDEFRQMFKLKNVSLYIYLLNVI